MGLALQRVSNEKTRIRWSQNQKKSHSDNREVETKTPRV